MRRIEPPLVSPQTLRLGEVRYELVRRIGGGALGDVYEARELNPGFERMVCIKTLAALDDDAPDSDGEPCGPRTLREEARLLAGVRHTNVVSLLAFGEQPLARPFLVLEFVQGVDLRVLSGRLREAEKRLPDDVAVHVACDLLRALAAVQRSMPGLVHRDVTPHNVLVSGEGEVKLGDFGIALARDRSQWTRPQFVKGKVGYMSPEQLVGRDIDPRSDVFSVGVVLYELLSGERPWGPLRGVPELRAVLERAPVPLSVRRPPTARPLAAAVDRLIARDRRDRFASAEDALRALAPFGAGELGSLSLAAYVRRGAG